jgi:hypothetical protein
MSGNCKCGCNSFRFKWDHKPDEMLFENICSNCQHTLAEHIDIVRSQQAN